MTLNGVLALILRYFTEFDRLGGLPVIFWPKLTHAESHGLCATAKLLVFNCDYFFNALTRSLKR